MAVRTPPPSAPSRPTPRPGSGAVPGRLQAAGPWRRAWVAALGWVPPARLVRAFAWAAVITNGLIAVTGATVRVTGSGLGCSTWPECQPGSLVPEYRTGWAAVHQAIEFGNRTITVLVLIASLVTFLLIWRRRPSRQLWWIAAVGPIGVLFQAVWGGIVVYTGLKWWTVAPHLLVSLVLVFAAVATLVRFGESDGPVRPTVPRPLRLLTWLTVAELAALCVAGTLVTAAGPHAGDVNTPRLDVVSVQSLAQLHADLMFLYLGLMAALGVGFLAVRAPRRLLVRTGVLVGITIAQGAIGLIQYALGVPELLVLAHVLGAVCLIAAAASVVMATRVHEPGNGQGRNDERDVGVQVVDSAVHPG